MGFIISTSVSLLYFSCRYDERRDRWERLSDMPTVRSNFGAASFEGRIFAVGGFNGQSTISQVDVYDPITARWTTLQGYISVEFFILANAVYYPIEVCRFNHFHIDYFKMYFTSIINVVVRICAKECDCV